MSEAQIEAGKYVNTFGNKRRKLRHLEYVELFQAL